MTGLIKKLFGFGKLQPESVQAALATAPSTASSSASNKSEEQDGFFTLEQQRLLVAQIQRQTQRKAIRIHATKTLSPLALTASKFGGMPYWNPAESYPTNEAGKPCVLLAQFDCQQLPHSHVGAAVLCKGDRDDAGKTPVSGFLSQGGRDVARTAPNRSEENLMLMIQGLVLQGTFTLCQEK